MENDNNNDETPRGIRYEYTPAEISSVKANPEEYIIPDCLEACKILWEKGINTYQCSNYEDHNYRFIDIDTSGMSEENLNFLYGKINSEAEGFTIGGLSKHPRIYVNVEGEEASKRLCELASMFSLQDTAEYRTVEEYLEHYRRNAGQPDHYTDIGNGMLLLDENPEFANATLSEALTANNDWDLYIEEEGRVYRSQEALQFHLQYLEKVGEQPPKRRKSI